MIYLRLSGGLGNQLYQLAAASLLASQHQSLVMVFLDGLKNYDAPRNPDSIKLLGRNDWLLLGGDCNQIIPRSLSVFGRVGRFLPVLGVNDKNFWSVVRAKKWTRLPVFMDGYFQRGWTLEAFEKALSLMRVKPIEEAAFQHAEKDEVIVHIRGGDFLGLPNFQVVNESFYTQTIMQAMQAGWGRFVVITDDIMYAEKIIQAIFKKLPNLKIRILPAARNSLEDFDVIRTASARIIGNSTFAWWATALGDVNAPTWSPTKFIVSESRDFFLPNELTIDAI